MEEENEDLRRKLLLISKICGGMGSDALALGGGENEAFRSLSAISEREDSSVLLLVCLDAWNYLGKHEAHDHRAVLCE